MTDKNAMAEVGDLLAPEVFYKDTHKEIYRVIEKLFQNAEPIDIFTIKDQLQKIKKLKFCGGVHYLGELTHKVISSSNIAFSIYIAI